MTQPNPRVSIGLPVYNGAKYLKQTLESLMAQTYTDYELIISDNGSNDETEQICRVFAAQYPKIRYYRYVENRGAAWNYNNTFDLARGEYFKWAAADDLCAPTFLERCVALLDAHPEVVVSFTEVIDVDGQDEVIGTKKSTVDFANPSASARFRSLSRVRPDQKCEEVFGIMRTEILAQTPLIQSYSDSDRTLLAELSLYGPFAEVPEPLFIHRIHSDNSVQVGRQARTAWFDTAAAGKLVFPNWRQFGELLRSIWRGPISMADRLVCLTAMGPWVKRRRRWLMRDLIWAASHVLGRLRPQHNRKVQKMSTQR